MTSSERFLTRLNSGVLVRLLVVSMVVGTVLAALAVRASVGANVENGLHHHGHDIEDRLISQVEGATANARGVRALLEAQAGVPSQPTYAAVVERLYVDGRPDEVLGINLVERVPAAEVDAWAAERGIGSVNLRLTSGDEHFILSRVAPFAGNEAAIGFDIRGTPQAWPAAEAAAALGVTQMTDPLRLIQAQDRPGYVLYVPTNRDQWLSVVMVADDVLAAAMAGDDFEGEVELVDVTNPADVLVVGDLGDEVSGSSVAHTHVIEQLGRTWELQLTMPSSALPATTRFAALGVLLMGLLASAAVGLLLTATSRAERRASRRADEATEHLEETIDQLEDALSVKDRILAVATHELRTPLTVIGGFTELLTSGRVDPSSDLGRDALEKVHRKTRQLTGIVDEMLLVARAQAGTLIASPEAVDADAAVRSILEDLGASGVVVDVGNAPDPWVDPEHFRRIVVNLLTNAIKYGAPPVQLSAGTEGSAFVLDVRDEGNGVPDEVASRIFEPFTQAAESQRHNKPGLGLGLSIVRTLAKANGGHAELLPSAVGAHFRVTLPSSAPRPGDRDQTPSPGLAST